MFNHKKVKIDMKDFSSHFRQYIEYDLTVQIQNSICSIDKRLSQNASFRKQIHWR